MSNILITGATGFIGRNLVRCLIAEGHHVRALVRDYERARKLLGTENIEYVKGDITDKKSLEHICEGIDVVYHLAAIMGHELPSEASFEKFRRVNTEGTKTIAESCLGTGIDKFIYVSSTAAMGLLRNGQVNEQTLCQPYTPYQVSKYEGELIVKELTERSGLPGVILRPSMVYGVGFKGDFVTIARVVKTGLFPKIGFGKNLSPALYIDDVIDCLSRAKSTATAGQIYIISSQESYELERVVRIIANALCVSVRMIFVPTFLAVTGAWILERLFLLLGKKPVVTARNIVSTTTDRVFDVTKAQRELGFQQRVSIEQGLAKAVDYFQAQGYVQ